MSGGKGTSSTPVTNTAQQTNPFAKYAEGAANFLTPIAQNQPYTAPTNPYFTAGTTDIANTASNIQGWPTARSYDAYGNLISGGGTSPAFPGYNAFASGTAGPQHNADIWAIQAAQGNAPNAAAIANYANQGAGGNVGQDELAAAAQGKYTDIASNPWLRQSADAALRQATEAYQRGTSPETAARFANSGRGNSGANDAAIRANEQAFLQGQGDITNKFYGQQYQFERDKQATEAAAYDQARRAGLGLGITGLQAAGNLTDQGLRTALTAADLTQRGQFAGLGGLTTGFNTSLDAQRQALSLFPQFEQALFAPGTATAGAGTALQNDATSQLREPYDRVRAYLSAISGGPSAGGSSSSTTPYYTNDVASGLSAGSGVLNLGKQLGLGSLFGGGAGAAGGSAATTAGLQALFPGAAASALPAYAAAAPELAATAASFAPAAASAAFTIICTELVRQGRMPNTWRLVGMRQFMRYPAIARRGYWVWATPVVAHLRRKPDSRFSRLIETTFNWRAEDLAARNGVKGARRLLRGRLVTAAMVIPCLACGLVARRDYLPDAKDAPA